MIADLLAALLRANLAAGAAIALVLALRKPARRLVGAQAAYGLWLIAPLAALAVLLPARQVSAPSPPPTTEESMPMIAAGPTYAAAPAPAAPQAIRAVAPKPAVSAARLTAQESADLLLGLWLAGVVLSLGALTVRQRRFLAKLGRLSRAPGDGRLLLAEGDGAGPAVVGALFPRVVLPADFERRFTAEEQAVVLAHEHAHLARQDARANGLVALAQCLNWFNPLVHVAGHFIRLDQELACDAAVVAALPGQRRRYAEALLKTQIAATPLPLGCYWPARSSHPLEERIAMLKHSAPGRIRRLAGLAAILAISLGGGVAAWASQPARLVESPPAPPVPMAVAPAAHLAQAPATPPAPVAAPADSPAVGDWIGALKSPDLRLAIHIRRNAAGELHAVLDSPDQATFDIPVNSVTATDSTLAFTIDRLKVRYDAKWDAASGQWLGQLTQGGVVSQMNLSRGTYPPAAVAAGLDGDWDGVLSAAALRLGIHIGTGPHGTLGRMDSPDQHSYGLPLTSVTRQGDTVTLTMKVIGMSYTGTLSPDGKTITGVFTQYASSMPFVLTRRAPGAPSPYPPAPPHPTAQARPPLPPVVSVDPQVLASYVGDYRFAPGLDMIVTLENGHLFAQVTDQAKAEIFPYSPTDFFWKVVPAEAKFAVGKPGDPAPYVVLHQNGRYILGTRV